MKAFDFGNLLRGKTVAVALSGGGDSMALLHYLCARAAEGGFCVAAVHVEHGIRGEASLKDAEFAEAYCREQKIPFYRYAVRARELAEREKLSLEAAARRLRYACFEAALTEKKCDFVALAHHTGDQAETVLMNLLRGAGMRGAGGMAPVRGRYLRPFLGVTKAEIAAYLKAFSIPYVTDETNFSADYTRNALRLRVLPAVGEIFPAYESSLLRFARLAREDDAYLFSLAKAQVAKRDGALCFPEDLPDPLFSRALLCAWKELGGGDYAGAQFEGAYALKSLANGACRDLGGGIVAAREYGEIALYRPVKTPIPSYPFAEGAFSFCGWTLKAERAVERKEGLYADAGKIPPGACLRPRKEGDVFAPYGGGTRKLKEYFIDKKVPRRLRDRIPVLAAGNTVYFVAGMEISDLIKVDKDTVNMIKLTYQRDTEEKENRDV